MNHDATHCADYLKSKCSKKCYRAQLTQELQDNWAYFSYLPISWANFKGTEICPIGKKEELKNGKNKDV